jgi:hypothetical protein
MITVNSKVKYNSEYKEQFPDKPDLKNTFSVLKIEWSEEVNE